MTTLFRLLAGATLLFAAVPSVSAQEALDWKNADALVAHSVEQSPTLARLDAEIAAWRERTASTGVLPNPMVMGGVQNYMVTFEEDEMMTMYMAGASQSFPRKSKREALKDAARLSGDRLEQQRQSALIELEREVRFAHYDVMLADARIAAVTATLSVADALIEATRVRYEVGTTIQADVIRAQLARTNLTHSLITLRTGRRDAAARLLTLLDLPPDTAIPSMPLSHAAHEFAPHDQYTAASVVAPSNPAIAAELLAVEIQEKELALARLATKPDWSIEGSYGYRSTQTDMFSVVASVELPIRRRTVIEPRVRAEAAERDAALQRVEELRRTLRRDLEVAHALREESEEQVRFHDQVLVPQARLAVDAGLASYQAGRDNFESILGSVNQYLQLELDYYGFLVEHAKALLEMKALTEGARAGVLRVGSPSMGSATPATAPAPSSMTSM
ncbi:MAG: TolC family protein [Thermoanaerobaculia bacterium]